MELIFATHNRHKAAEIEHKLSGSIKIINLDQVGITEDIPEPGDSLRENAFLKAKYVYDKTGKACFADDTGLEVTALGGAPGVRSARYAGEQASLQENLDKLLSQMEDVQDRQARFRTVIAYINENGEVEYFEGSIEGEITTEPRGEEGFGYDPVFIPNGFEETFAQMSKGEKNAISHRGRAVLKFTRYLMAHQNL